MKNYDEITNDLLERRNKYFEEKQIKRSKNVRIVVSVCSFCFAGLLCFGIWQSGNFNPTPEDQTVNDALYPGIKDTFDDKNGESVSNPSKNNKVVINVLDQPLVSTDVPFWFPKGEHGIALMLNDFVEMTKEEMLTYYGFNYLPIVPDDLNSLYENREHGIFKRNGGTGEVYWDADIVNFTNEDETRSVHLQVNKGFQVFVDWFQFKGSEEKSCINNVEVLIGLAEDGSYYAEFMYKDVGFLMFSYGLTEQEFVAVISSIIK